MKLFQKKGAVDDLIDLPESYYGFIFHYYRAEIYRETNWRNRMDTTTNWSIVVTAAILSFAFSNENIPHSVILVNYALVLFFLYIEARRFRYYWQLRQRTRLLEKHLFSGIFGGKEKKEKSDWKEKLVASFHSHDVGMSRMDSIGWRLRRNYFLILPMIFISWLAKVQSYPYPASDFSEYILHAKVWIFPGILVFTLFLLSIVAAFVLALYVPYSEHHSDLP